MSVMPELSGAVALDEVVPARAPWDAVVRKGQTLRIVDQLETASNEIRRPFTQAALLEKAAQLLEARGVAGAATSSLA